MTSGSVSVAGYDIQSNLRDVSCWTILPYLTDNWFMYCLTSGATANWILPTGKYHNSSSFLWCGFILVVHFHSFETFCFPQFDALIERLTGRELLTMFARLRGVPERQIKAIVNTEIARVDLKKYADKKCGSYRLAFSFHWQLECMIPQLRVMVLPYTETRAGLLVVTKQVD